MRYIKTDDYDKFKCIADRCPDTCCAGWQIMIDEGTLERYEEVAADKTDEFRKRMEASIDWQEGTFKQCHGRCAMLNEQNLCDLVIEKGEAWLCETCDRYPRHIEEFDGVREMSLSLSCPVAAQMMLDREEPMQFLMEEDEESEPLEEEFEDFDFLLFTQLEDARNVLFAIAQNREVPMSKRMMTLIQMAKDMQACVDEERLYDMEDAIERYAKWKDMPENSNAQEDPNVQISEIVDVEKRYCYLKENFAVFHEMERLRDEWTEVLTQAENVLYANGYERYGRICEAFRQDFIATFGEKKWEIFQEQILMFFLYTYFCGAVYDDWIYSKVAMAVFSVCYIQEFIMCAWYLAERRMDMQECIRMAYRYAREVEHSDENLNLLEEWLMEEAL